MKREYLIGGLAFANKAAVTERCQNIMADTPLGDFVDVLHTEFLLALFGHHDKWTEKLGQGILRIGTAKDEFGNRYFTLERAEGGADISWRCAVRNLPTGRKLIPQGKIDFCGGLRWAVEDQISGFRNLALARGDECPITGARLSGGLCAVDHAAPWPFDTLAFEFCVRSGIDPLTVPVDDAGTVPVILDLDLVSQWRAFHREFAVLRLLSKSAHSRLPQDTKNPWHLLSEKAT